MELSKRLQAIADMVPVGSRVADVGCDHGFLSIYLYEKGICPKVYAMDVREGPLMRAKEHVAEYGYGDYIECRLSDGLKELETGEANVLVCAGMGGRLMAKILGDSLRKVSLMDWLILQPQSDLAFFRRFLKDNRFVFQEENMVKEDGKFYPMMRVMHGVGAWYGCEFPERIQDAYGPILLADRHPVLEEYLRTVYQRNEGILAGLGDANRDRREELLKEQADIRYCLERF